MGARPIEIGPAHRHAAANIVRLRKAQNLTQKGLAERLKEAGHPLLHTAVARIETCERRIDIDDLASIAAVLRVEPGRLLVPFHCPQCHGEPPAGFTCKTCGA